MPSQPPGWSIDVTIANGIKKIIKPTLKYLDTSKTIPVRQADKITMAIDITAQKIIISRRIGLASVSSEVSI